MTETAETVASLGLHVFTTEQLVELQESLRVDFAATLGASPVELISRVTELVQKVDALLADSQSVWLSFGHTAVSAIGLLPQVRACIAASDMELAQTHFGIIRRWVELVHGRVDALRDENKAVIAVLGSLVESARDWKAQLVVDGLGKINAKLRAHLAFWATVELNEDNLLQITVHVDELISTERDPRLAASTLHRIDDLAKLWEGIILSCARRPQLVELVGEGGGSQPGVSSGTVSKPTTGCTARP